LISHLQHRGYELVDIQQLTPHTATFGAVEISRREYLARVAVAQERDVTFGDEMCGVS
jgi:leucyl/phenylalanyl-tRNA--protein transferase